MKKQCVWFSLNVFISLEQLYYLLFKIMHLFYFKPQPTLWILFINIQKNLKNSTEASPTEINSI